jgi:RimJ/RimL family protein N-acetyltransferase
VKHPARGGELPLRDIHFLRDLIIIMAELFDNIFLRGRRILIRPLEREDIDRRLKWKPYPDPLYFHYNLGNLKESEKEDWFLKRKRDTTSIYLSIDNAEGNLIGFLRLYKIEPQDKTAWFGIHLGYEFVDRGLGTEAALALLRTISRN